MRTGPELRPALRSAWGSLGQLAVSSRARRSLRSSGARRRSQQHHRISMRVSRTLTALTAIAAASCDDTLPPQGQVVLLMDTDAPLASPPGWWPAPAWPAAGCQGQGNVASSSSWGPAKKGEWAECARNLAARGAGPRSAANSPGKAPWATAVRFPGDREPTPRPWPTKALGHRSVRGPPEAG